MILDSHRIDAIFRNIQQAYWELVQKHPATGTSFIRRPSLNSPKKIDDLRNRIDELDAKIHLQVLLADTLHRAFAHVEATYCSLKEERQDLLSEIDELESRQPIALPAEIMIKICSYLTKDDFDSVFEVWGDVACKAIPMEYTFEKLFQASPKVLEKISHINLADHIGFKGSHGTYPNIVATLERGVPLGSWKELTLHDDCYGYGHREVFIACGPYLSNTKKIKLITGHGSSLSNRHGCQESSCFEGIAAPACTELSVPFAVLACTRNFNPGGILHLEIDFKFIDDISSLSRFTSYFQGIDITSLQTLTVHLHWNSDFDFQEPPVLLPTPNLRTFTTRFLYKFSSSEILFAFSKCFDCPKLETLEIFGEFRNIPRDPFIIGSESTIHLNRFYGSLVRLSIQLGMTASENVRYLSTIFKELRGREGADIPFPRLTHLAFHYDDPWINFDDLQPSLKALLDHREKSGSPIRIIELVLDEDFAEIVDQKQRLEIDRYQLLVKNLLITSNGKHSKHKNQM